MTHAPLLIKVESCTDQQQKKIHVTTRMQHHCSFVDAEAIEETEPKTRPVSGTIVVDGLSYGQIIQPTWSNNAYIMSVARAQSQEARDDGLDWETETNAHDQRNESYDSDDSFINNSEQTGTTLSRKIREMARDSGSSFRANSTVNQPSQLSQVRRYPTSQRHKSDLHTQQQLTSVRQKVSPARRDHYSKQRPLSAQTRWDKWRRKNKARAKKKEMQGRGHKEKPNKQIYHPEPKTRTHVSQKGTTIKYKMPRSDRCQPLETGDTWTCHAYKAEKLAGADKSRDTKPNFHLKFTRKKRIVIHESSSSDEAE